MASGGYRDFTLLPLGTGIFPPVPPPSAPVVGVLGFIDFSMLPSGQALLPAQPPPVAGYLGIIDFSFLPAAQGGIVPPPQPPVPGFFGFLDFAGYPVAQGTGAVIPPRPGHGFRGAGRYANAILQQIEARRRRTRQDHRIRKFPPQSLIREMLTERVIHNRWEKERLLRKKKIEAAMYSVLLVEI